MYVCMHVSVDVCMFMYACMYVCTFSCMYIFVDVDLCELCCKHTHKHEIHTHRHGLGGGRHHRHDNRLRQSRSGFICQNTHTHIRTHAHTKYIHTGTVWGEGDTIGMTIDFNDLAVDFYVNGIYVYTFRGIVGPVVAMVELNDPRGSAAFVPFVPEEFRTKASSRCDVCVCVCMW
jgi:hypothetical protein